MASEPNTSRPLRVAVVGAGPAGFYAVSSLLDSKDWPVSVDLFERLLAPYGLVRYGVAPDHPKIKSVTRVYERVALDDRVRFLGNVTVGGELPVEDLRRFYDVIIYAVGAQTDRIMGIPGEELAGSISSTAFVSWYNAHPDYADFALTLDHEKVAVVGIGNVALDVARILARSTGELARTDIADPALARLRQSRVTDVHVLARRGPAQAKCTPAELKELGEIEGVDVVVDPKDLVLSPSDEALLARDRQTARNLDILRGFAATPPTNARRVHLRFFVSPIEVVGEHGTVEEIRLERNELQHAPDGSASVVGTGEVELLDVSLVIRAIGYRSVPLPGVPFDERRGLIPNQRGQVIDPDTGSRVEREYVVGWAKRGPQGLIGSNKGDAAETVATLLGDLPDLGLNHRIDPDPEAVLAHAGTLGIRYTEFDHWQLLDRLETDRGEAEGRPRVKFVRTEDMLRQIDGPEDSQ